MIPFDVNKIAKKLEAGFHSPKRPASGFANKKLWDDCKDIFREQNQIEKIVFANELGVPPAKALIRILIDDFNYPPGTVFTAQEARNLGSLINYIFKEVLGYDTVYDRRVVKLGGIKEGCIFAKSNTDVPKISPSPVKPIRDFGEWQHFISK